uniref:EOG090X0HAI n=1 Tax=Daphnia similis TaxID=35528 RepID=A0A4Y7LU58_9CRUS|nr:EOG090X0HAI [Daphnia similis]SVE71402.1 EOG090X0HAI [Daphnia similis]SVE72035.1 EOG090X0HAI [Daphnia similis]SVE72662.1 EOG090X0HAI [Daphnia similis]
MAVENFGKDIGADGLLAAASVLERPAEEFVNDSMIEELWAIKAFEHAEIYFNLLSSVDPKLLRLTKHDDQLYKHFRETFPDLNVATVTEDQLKSAEAKDVWRSFCEIYKESVEDYNYATLIRLNAAQEYSEANSMIVPRVQFLAIELARSREGHNDMIRFNFKPKKLQTRS